MKVSILDVLSPFSSLAIARLRLSRTRCARVFPSRPPPTLTFDGQVPQIKG